MEHKVDSYELVGDNLTYTIEDFKHNSIVRLFNIQDTGDKLPNADQFISLFPLKEAKQVYEFLVTNGSQGVLILNPGDNIIFRENVYILAPGEKKEFMACIFSVEPCIIGVVSK